MKEHLIDTSNLAPRKRFQTMGLASALFREECGRGDFHLEAELEQGAYRASPLQRVVGELNTGTERKVSCVGILVWFGLDLFILCV